VLKAIRDVCKHYGWSLPVAHVRTSHVQAVVEAEGKPEKVMNAFKTCAIRALNAARLDAPGRRCWARHGSARWLFTQESARKAIGYVAKGQGEPMALFVADAD